MKIIECIKLSNGSIRRRVHEDFTEMNDDGEIVAVVSMTDQSFAKDCDVNEIVARFNKTGQISHLAKKQGVYADLSEITDLLDMSIKLEAANEAFLALPSELRERLGNDPINLPTYLSDPKNEEELLDLGILIPKKTSAGSTPSSSKKVKNEDLKTATKNKPSKNQTQTTTNDDTGDSQG